MLTINKKVSNHKIINAVVQYYCIYEDSSDGCLGDKICVFLGVNILLTHHNGNGNKKLCRWCGRNMVKNLLKRADYMPTFINYYNNRCRTVSYIGHKYQKQCNKLYNNKIIKACSEHLCKTCKHNIINRFDIICALLCGRSLLLPYDIITHVLVPLLRPRLIYTHYAHMLTGEVREKYITACGHHLSKKE